VQILYPTVYYSTPDCSGEECAAAPGKPLGWAKADKRCAYLYSLWYIPQHKNQLLYISYLNNYKKPLVCGYRVAVAKGLNEYQSKGQWWNMSIKSPVPVVNMSKSPRYLTPIAPVSLEY